MSLLGAQNGHHGRTVVAPANVAFTSRHRCLGVHFARSAAFGDTKAWERWYADPKEVYLFRVNARNAEIKTPDDALRFLRAAAKNQKMKLDARGVTVGYRPNGEPRIDIVFTADTMMPYVAPTMSPDMIAGMLSDHELRERYPDLVLENGHFLQLTGPPQAIDFWLAQAPLWDDQVGPTDAFVKVEGVYKGQSDDGPQAQPWTLKPPDLDDKDDKGKKPWSPPWAVIALGGAAVTAVAAHLLSKGTR